MAAKTIVALPVDGRPVTREQVQMLARIADCELVCPAVEDLGYFREPANREFLRSWVLEHAPGADGFIFSIDMLVYGGLVPSRFVEDDYETLLGFLELLQELRAAWPDKPVYAFCATMRLSNNNENEEEKLYWSEYGELIWQWSFFSDRYQCLQQDGDMGVAERARAAIPASVRDDYLRTRKRNFSVTCRVLELVREGVIDRLVLPQDDTAEYGFNIAERRTLQSVIAGMGLEDRVLVYPGADEVIYTLLAFQLQVLGVVHAPRIVLSPHHPDALEQMVARYEDRPVLESVHCQLAAAGALVAEGIGQADVVLAIHCQGSGQGDWAMGGEVAPALGNDPAWLRQLAVSDKPVALLDLAYANGGDPALLAELALAPDDLLAYAGWNTASNSIGSLVAQICVAQGRCGPGQAGRVHNRHLLATRLLDDYLYQSGLRGKLRAGIDERCCSPEQLLQRLRALYPGTARQWLQEQGFCDIELRDVYLPWRRSFEIGLRTEIVERQSQQAGVPA
ncbi:DUF4127 family protein [Biformimicrobium ophioploci]|uniref:DUF4127 family protein n=1 Tax=Biformimicrobium ophioploci TaxID=3036711 RepID=A0ABQ6LWH9_9GAMM|nr:DUF4127 family protein [Microbulbifer sp. NKW57]GMG86469.1 DUF4127 family protein [Microbulbifer sp. NKW57]